MGWRMKNFNNKYFGGLRKNLHEKPVYRDDCLLKLGLGGSKQVGDKHSQKWTPYLFQNVALHFEPDRKQKNVADINFLVLHCHKKAFQQKFGATFCGWPGQKLWL